MFAILPSNNFALGVIECRASDAELEDEIGRRSPVVVNPGVFFNHLAIIDAKDPPVFCFRHPSYISLFVERCSMVGKALSFTRTRVNHVAMQMKPIMPVAMPMA